MFIQRRIKMDSPTTAAGERAGDGPNASATCTAQPTTNTSGGSTAAGRIRDGTLAAIPPSSPGVAGGDSVPPRSRWHALAVQR